MTWGIDEFPAAVGLLFYAYYLILTEVGAAVTACFELPQRKLLWLIEEGCSVSP